MGSVDTYYIETYGCALATYESLVMSEILSSKGLNKVNNIEKADIIIVNTCAVRLDTEQRIAERLRYIAQNFPEKKIIVTGCLAKARPGLILRITPNASLLAPQAIPRIYEAIISPHRIIDLDSIRNTNIHALKPVQGRIATIMIQEGCRNKCSYCITKVARGAPRSFPPRIIIEQVKNSVSKGAVEIRLTGTDTGAYGIDLPGKPSLADLVSMILDKVDGFYRIRIGMMTPEEALRIIDDLLDIYSEERVFKFFHIPVQSGSDKILKIMGRRYSRKEFIWLHARIKKRFPESLFATDIIVGHPGEDEVDFNETVSLVRELKFERVHLAQYSLRPHTRAASMKQLSDRIKKKRSKILSKIIENIGKSIYSKYLDKELTAIPTHMAFRGNAVTARTQSYYPVILHGVTLEELPLTINVRIIGYSFFDLRGKIA